MSAGLGGLEGSEYGVAAGVDAGVLRIEIDRPERKGSLDTSAVGRMITVLEAAGTDDTLRVVVLTSAGEDFCTGADLVAANTPRGGSGGGAEPTRKPRTGSLQRRTALQAHRLIAVMLEVQLPVVCVVRGWAAGLGFQLALASDFCVAAADARFAAPFVRRGLVPDSGASWLVPRLVGLARARQLLMLGRELSGTEAHELGMIHDAVPTAELSAASDALVAELAAAPTVALGLTKRCLNSAADGGIVQAMEAEAMALELASRTADFREGMAAFRERREPDFEGR